MKHKGDREGPSEGSVERNRDPTNSKAEALRSTLPVTRRTLAAKSLP